MSVPVRRAPAPPPRPLTERPSRPAHQRAKPPSRRQNHRRLRRERRRQRRTAFGRHPWRTALLVVVVGLTPVWISFGDALANPSFGSSMPARAAEWVREHGGAPVVNWAENLWYSHHPPPVGGVPPKGAIPPPVKPATAGSRAGHAGSLPPSASRSGSGVPAAPVALPTPKPIVPLASPPIAGEGDWHPAGRLVDGKPAVYEAFLRPDAIHTSQVVGVAWMDTHLLKAALYSGSTIPGGGPYPLTAPISPSASRSLVTAFNAGFQMADAEGGYYTDGKTIIPLRAGAASFVVYKNGDATVGAWGSQVKMTPDVVAVRQNLDLLVNDGQAVPGLNPNDTSQWGYTLGNAVYVWRSGVGVTANGALVYVGGPALNITTLADLLVRAGAVRAMELDINTDWVSYSVYSPSTPTAAATPANGSDLLPAMSGGPARWFQSWWSRDFITMSAR